jgi:Protein of unknown function (DUF3105)
VREQEGQGSAASGSERSARSGKARLFAAYATVAVLALAALAAAFVLSSGSDSAAHGNPHINLDSGITNGIVPDNRVGIEPPHLEEQSLQKAARAAGCELRLRLPNEGSDHIPSSAREPRYRTSPPTSGDHVEEQQADGAYRETPPPANVVHSLEHGRLAIQYRPDLPERVQRELIGLFDGIYGGTLLFPNQEMPYLIAATTWTNLLGCHTYRDILSLNAIQMFAKTTWGKYGGEPIAGLQPGSPTPARPAKP